MWPRSDCQCRVSSSIVYATAMDAMTACRSYADCAAIMQPSCDASESWRLCTVCEGTSTRDCVHPRPNDQLWLVLALVSFGLAGIASALASRASLVARRAARRARVAQRFADTLVGDSPKPTSPLLWRNAVAQKIARARAALRTIVTYKRAPPAPRTPTPPPSKRRPVKTAPKLLATRTTLSARPPMPDYAPTPSLVRAPNRAPRLAPAARAPPLAPAARAPVARPSVGASAPYLRPATLPQVVPQVVAPVVTRPTAAPTRTPSPPAPSRRPTSLGQTIALVDAPQPPPVYLEIHRA